MNGRRRLGFTLLELVLVIAIIVVLVALLLPAFASARKQARMATCTSNLRQLGMAFNMYAADYGTYPNPMQFVKSVRDRKLLHCPEDSGSQPSASSYSFRSVLPPDFKPYWQEPELDTNTVLLVCSQHLEQRIEKQGEVRRQTEPRYPFKLALRAGGGVERIHLNDVRELMVPGDHPSFIRVYPKEPGYQQARR
jgi:prepilin-type N-terminal cleavage/methylation domain-containing protein